MHDSTAQYVDFTGEPLQRLPGTFGYDGTMYQPTHRPVVPPRNSPREPIDRNLRDVQADQDRARLRPEDDYAGVSPIARDV